MGMSLNSGLTMDTIFNVLTLSCVSIVLGFVLARVHMYKNNSNKGFIMTLALLPFIIQLIIMLVNGNVGTGVAVMGAFSLVRFRSMPGSAKEIGSIFATMAVGLAIGVGQIVVATIFTVIYCLLVLTYEIVGFGGNNGTMQLLKITIPEDLYTADAFIDILDRYTVSYELTDVKTTNMGTLFRLNYKIRFDQSKNVKEFLNELRCRNGNLEINYNLVLTDSNSL